MAKPVKNSARERARLEPLIVIVDDEHAVAEVIQACLELRGYKAVVYTDPGEALRGMVEAEQTPLLLITDYLMPKMNGMELIQKCREELPDLKVISASGTLHITDTLDHVHQPDHFIAKPFYPNQLLDAVDELLDALDDRLEEGGG